MSKKTENILKTIDALQTLQTNLAEYNKTVESREISDIEFNMGQELKKLRFLFESLYSYNGKSKSLAKKQASKENGKKGGRPPKDICAGKKRLQELDSVIPELQHKIELSDDSAEHEVLEKQIEELEKEKSIISIKLTAYYNSKI